jgi:beta-phosphoglucomutase
MSDWPQAVLFDFDGVIVNSEPLHFRALAEVLAGEGIEITEDEYFRDLIGFDDRGAIRTVFASHERPLDPPTLLRVLTLKSRAMMEMIHRRQYKPLPGVEELVRGLWWNYPLAICSGALREEIEAMLEGIALRDCFGTIVAAEDVEVGKPDPSGYLLCTRLVGDKMRQTLRPEDCLVVEDAPAVVRSVKAAGFPTLAVASSYFPDKLTDADWIVRSLDPDSFRQAIPQMKLEPRLGRP